MSGLEWALLGLAGAGAAFTTWAVAAGRDDVERFAGPATAVVAAWAAVAVAADGSSRWWLVAAAVALAAGDLFTVDGQWRPAMAALVVAQVAAIGAFTAGDPSVLAGLIGAAVAIVILVEIGRPVLAELRLARRDLLAGASVHAGVSGVLVGMGFATGIGWAAVGASTWAIGGGLDAHERFGRGPSWQRAVGVGLTHAGLVLAVASLAVTT